MTIPGNELPEKDFINEGYKKNPLPLWLWFFLLIFMISLLWGMSNWYSVKINFLFQESPFLRVTNRQMSLFLWQNPEFMRANVKEKGGYLPGFKYVDKVTLDIAYADEFVAAPPELIFRYHTWNRLVSGEFTQRPIPKKEFQEFLSYAEEWHPRYWPEAPQGYIKLVNELAQKDIPNLATLSEQELPIDVRMAFQGWQNYFKDGEAINQLRVTQTQMGQFLSSHSHYTRNYWRNIVEDKIPNYLKSVTTDKAPASESAIPANELSSFLRVAIYNYLKAQEVEPKAP